MAKIVLITQSTVRVRFEDGSAKTFPIEDVRFTPEVNDEVEIFSNGEKEVVVKAAGFEREEPQKAFIPQTPPGKKAVNKLAYCLLAFFLGGIGIHKFYGGKIIWGIVYICFCWTGIPAIIALIEFFIALFKKADSFGNIYV